MTIETTPNAPTGRGFEDLDLDPELLSNLKQLGFTEPTPIQRAAIPHALEARDLLASAQTGTGKTAAFALPILDELLCIEPERNRPIRALVLTPTRELAAQVAESFNSYYPGDRIRCAVVFGGVGKRPQVDALKRGIDVLVATPGRLLDLMQDGVVDLSHVEMYVLDEADRMLDMGFLPDVRRVTEALPKKRQTLLFSATQPREIRQLAARLLYKPIEIAVDPIASTVEPIEQKALFVEGPYKLGVLVKLLSDATSARTLVFTRTKRRADRLAKSLTRQGFKAAAIHGDKAQTTRVRTLEDFRTGGTPVLVATDVAARGIHVENIDTVVNYDLPTEPETYVHRIGRTGRAGASGIALTLCARDERSALAGIERLIRREIAREAAPRVAASKDPLPKNRPDHRRRSKSRGRSRGRAVAAPA